MKKVNRIISAIVLAAFLCNTFLVDASFAQDILGNRNSSTLGISLKSDDMLGIERQDMHTISMWFRGCLVLIAKKGLSVNLENLKNPKVLSDEVLDGMKDFRFLRHSDISQDPITGVIQIKVRRRAGLSMKTYWVEYLPSGDRLRVYPDGAQVPPFAPHRPPAPNAREFDILGKAGVVVGRQTNRRVAENTAAGLDESQTAKAQGRPDEKEAHSRTSRLEGRQTNPGATARFMTGKDQPAAGREAAMTSQAIMDQFPDVLGTLKDPLDKLFDTGAIERDIKVSPLLKKEINEKIKKIIRKHRTTGFIVLLVYMLHRIEEADAVIRSNHSGGIVDHESSLVDRCWFIFKPYQIGIINYAMYMTPARTVVSALMEVLYHIERKSPKLKDATLQARASILPGTDLGRALLGEPRGRTKPGKSPENLIKLIALKYGAGKTLSAPMLLEWYEENYDKLGFENPAKHESALTTVERDLYKLDNSLLGQRLVEPLLDSEKTYDPNNPQSQWKRGSKGEFLFRLTISGIQGVAEAAMQLFASIAPASATKHELSVMSSITELAIRPDVIRILMDKWGLIIVGGLSSISREDLSWTPGIEESDVKSIEGILGAIDLNLRKVDKAVPEIRIAQALHEALDTSIREDIDFNHAYDPGCIERYMMPLDMPAAAQSRMLHEVKKWLNQKKNSPADAIGAFDYKLVDIPPYEPGVILWNVYNKVMEKPEISKLVAKGRTRNSAFRVIAAMMAELEARYGLDKRHVTNTYATGESLTGGKEEVAPAPAATVKRTKAINEIWKGLSGQTDIRKPINLFTESMIEDDWVRVAVGSLAEEMIAGIEGLKIYSKAGKVPDVWGSTDIYTIYLKLTFKARLNSIRDRNLSARKLKAVKEWLIQESRKLAALDTSLNNTLLPLLSPVETMPETPAPAITSAPTKADPMLKEMQAALAEGKDLEVRGMFTSAGDAYLTGLTIFPGISASRQVIGVAIELNERHANLLVKLGDASNYQHYRNQAQDLRKILAQHKDGGEDAHFFAERVPRMTATELAHYVMNSSIGYVQACIAIRVLSNPGHEALLKGFLEKLYSELGIKNAIDTHLTRIKVDAYIIELNSQKKSVPVAKSIIANLSAPAATPELTNSQVASLTKDPRLPLLVLKLFDAYLPGHPRFHVAAHIRFDVTTYEEIRSIVAECYPALGSKSLVNMPYCEAEAELESAAKQGLLISPDRNIKADSPLYNLYSITPKGQEEADAIFSLYKHLSTSGVESGTAKPVAPAATPAPAAEPDQAAAGAVITVGGETLKLRETPEREFFPRGVRNELNLLRETIFGVTEEKGASFEDIKAALATQYFKFLDTATFTDISSLTENSLNAHYEGGYDGGTELVGRIKYMVVLRYTTGIVRRVPHTAIVVLASGKTTIDMAAITNFVLYKVIDEDSMPAAQRLIIPQVPAAEPAAGAEEILSAQRISSMTADGLAVYVMKAEKGSTYVTDILRLFTPTSSTLTGFITSLSKKLVLAKPADIGLTIRSLASALRKLAEVPGSVSAQLDPSISPGEWTIETKQMLFKRYTSLFEGQSGIKDELRNIIDLISRPGGLRPSVNKLNMDIHNGVYGAASHILPSIYYMGAGDQEYYPLLVKDDAGNIIPVVIKNRLVRAGGEQIRRELSPYIISKMPDDDIRFMIKNLSAGEPAFVTDSWLDYLDLRYLAAYCGTTEARPAATPAPAQNDTLQAHLRDIAARIVPANGGILAADESTGTAGKRLESVGLPNTPENRQTMRQLILMVPGLKNAGVSAVILYSETFDNLGKNDENLVQEHLVKRGILPGIKTDAGLIDDPDSPGEKLPDPKGLQKLPELLAKYKAKGAVFTKWRVTLSIDTVKGLPTDANIRKNAVVLANSAKQTQEADLVPIIEPEVLLDGSHDIAASYKATTRTLEIVFEELAKAGVWLDGVVLKTSMILSGNKAANRADSEMVGYQTLKGLLKTVPQEVPAIVFLSGGQEDDEANNNLNAVTVTSQTKFETVRDEAAAELKAEGKTDAAAKLSQLKQVPWQLSYSFGRGLQRSGLRAWAGKSKNFEKAQEALLEAARTTQKARLGLLRAWPRPSEVSEDKRVVVLISGGESAGVNNYFAQLAVGLAEQGYSLEVVRFGLDGLVQPREEFAKNLVWIDEKRSYSIINMPGAVEGTARVSLSDEKHPEYMQNAVANLKGYCKTVIMVGGSDHMAEATKISNELRAQGINDMVVIALPKSVDYDAPNVYMIGADTAGSYANKFVIRAAPMPWEKKVVVSEIMGRDSGYLTVSAANMNTADRSGYTEAELRKMKAIAPTLIALIPEWSVDERGASIVSLADVVNAVKRRMNKYGAATVVVSEGFRISPDDELLRRILENPFFKDKFTNVKKDKQGNLLFNEIGIGNFVTEALSIALGEELKLEREKNLLYELPGYSFRCVQPGEIDMAVADSATAKAADMIINRRDEVIQRGGVCIAIKRGIKSASDIKAEVRDLPQSKGTVSLKDFVIFTKDELAAKNVLGLADESAPLPDMGSAASLPAFREKDLSLLVEAINSQSESARDMRRLNICTIAGQDADMLISRVASHKPLSLAESYVHERTSGAVMYVTAGQSGALSLGRLIDEINQRYTANQHGIRFANVVISANVLFKENDETLVRLQKDNPSFAALVAAAKKDADGFLNFGRHIADVVTMALSIDKKISGIRKNVLGESLNSLPQVAPAPAPEVAIESSVSVLQGIMKLVQAEWLDGWLNFEGLAKAVQLAECQGKIITDDDNSTMIFSEISTFGKRNEDGTYEEGLGIILPSLVKSDIRVAVVATTSRQKVLIDELNAGLTEGQQIIHAESVPEVMAKIKTARYYYFKVASEADAGTGVTSITIIVKKILDAIGKVADIINPTVIEQMHEAARQFAAAA